MNTTQSANVVIEVVKMDDGCAGDFAFIKMVKFIGKYILIALFLSFSFAASGVIAQSTVDTGSDRISAYRWNDGGPVDIQSGSFIYSADDISIGSGTAPSRLTLTRRLYRIGTSGTNPNFANEQISSFGRGMEHNFESSAECSWQINSSCQIMTVHINGQRHQFSTGANKYNPNVLVTWAEYLEVGDTLTETSSVWIFRSKDGFEADFPKDSQHSCNLYCALASQWVWPNGDKISFYYEQAYILHRSSMEYNDNPPLVQDLPVNRLTQVRNLHGDSIVFTYVNPPGGTVANERSLSAADYLRLTVKTVTADRSSCTTTASTACASGTPGVVSYNYSSDDCTNLFYPGGIFPVLASINHVNGSQTTLTWEEDTNQSRCSYHALISESDPTSTTGGLIFSNQYDGQGGVISYKDGAGRQWSYSRQSTTSAPVYYAASSTTDPLGNKTSYTFNGSLPGPLTITDANNNKTSIERWYQYVTKITTPLGIVYNYTRDSTGNLTNYSITPLSGVHADQASIQGSAVFAACNLTNWKICNKPTSVTDARGNVVGFVYDANHGGVTTITSPAPVAGSAAPQKRISYTLIQGVYLPTSTSECRTTASCSGTADERTTSVSYDQNLNVSASSISPGAGGSAATNHIYYDGIGNVVSTTDPLGNTTIYTYDAARQLTASTSPDPDGSGALHPRTISYHYTLRGQLDAIAAGYTGSSGFVALQTDQKTFDGSARTLTESLLSGGTTYRLIQFSYDADGRLDCTALRMNSAVFGTLPAACTLGPQGGYGPDRISRNTYDPIGQVLSVTQAYGTAFPRVVATYTYSADGKVLTLSDANSNLTTEVYDGFDRLYQTRYPSPTTVGVSNVADYEQLAYDSGGNVTGRRLRGSTLAAGSYDIAYGYDALGRTISKTLPSPDHAVAYTYDNFGDPLTITGATSLSYGWDALGRKTSETQAYGSVAFQYDVANRTTQLTWQDGVYLTYDYDNLNEMIDIKENGATVLAAFTYDDLGERKTRSLANGTSTTYGYDPVSRLTSLVLAGGTNANTTTLSNYSPAAEIGTHSNSNDAFAWTGATNVNRAYTANGLNQFATIAGATQGYDGRGNLTGSGGTTYAYTSENLLKAAGSATLAYDPMGRLQEYDTPTATRFVYDGGAVSEELNGSGNVLRRYVFGPAGDEPIVWYEGSDTTTKRYIDQDERGSVTRITDATGATFAINSYDEYGIPSSANQGRFGYTGQAWLFEIGLSYYKARVYSPTLGRFIQTDPSGYSDGSGWYNYATNDPVNGLDPTGLQSADLSGATPIGSSSGGSSLSSSFADGSTAYYGPSSLIGGAPELRMTYGAPIGQIRSAYHLDPGKVEGDPFLMSAMFAGAGVTARGVYALFDLGYSALSRLIIGEAAAEGVEGTGTALTSYYPANNGFLGASSETTLEAGQTIDRYGGSAYSQFFSPQGVPAEMRSLPPGVAEQGLRTFQVTQQFSVESGTVAPAFGQFGLGTQYRSSMTLGELLEQGYLSETTP